MSADYAEKPNAQQHRSVLGVNLGVKGRDPCLSAICAFQRVAPNLPQCLSLTKLITFLECRVATFGAQEYYVAMETKRQPDITLSIWIFSQMQMEGATKKNKEREGMPPSSRLMQLVTCKDVFGVKLQVDLVLLGDVFHYPVRAMVLLRGQQPAQRLREHPKRRDGGESLK